MSRNGSGAYSLPAGNPVVTGTTISSTVHNNTLSDIATALTQSIAKDGQTTPTANLPMGGYKHTGVATASSLTDYARADQVQDSAFSWLSSVTGTDTITASISPTPAAYAAGQTFRFISAGANTGAATLNVSSLGAKSIKKRGTTALEAGDIPNGAVVTVTYDGTNFQLNAPDDALVAGDIGSTVQAYDADIPTVAASQGEMEAGTEAALRSMSPLRVAQAIAALGGSGGVIPYNHISGLLPTAISGNSTTAAVTVSAGQAVDTTYAVAMTGNFSWAVSNGNAANGYQGGTTLPSSSTIHFYICKGGSGTCSFASTSLTPTLPSGYNTHYRRIFSILTDGSGAPIPYTPVEINGGGTINWLATQTLDISTTNAPTSRTAYTLNIPSGVKHQPVLRVGGNASGTNGAVILTSGDETDVTPTGSPWTTVPGCDVGSSSVSNIASVSPPLTTNTSGQINVRANASNQILYVVTRGFIDFRRG